MDQLSNDKRRVAVRLILAISTLALSVFASCETRHTGAEATAPFEQVFPTLRALDLVDDATAPLGSPIALAHWEGDWVLADQMLGELKVFDSTGRWRQTIGSGGEGPGEFSWPVSLAVTSDGLLAVLDRSLNRVSYFDRAGAVVSDWVAPPGRFSSIAVLEDGRVILAGYLADGSGDDEHTVHVLSPTGELSGSLHPRDSAWRPTERNFSSVHLSVRGSQVATVESGSNRVFVTDLSDMTTREIVVESPEYRPVQWPEQLGGGLDSATAWYHRQTWITRLLLLEGGLVVRLSTFPDGTAEARWVVTDGSGRSLVSTKPNQGETLNIALSDDRFAGFWSDDYGNVAIGEFGFGLEWRDDGAF